jgi:hypothetical protein
MGKYDDLKKFKEIKARARHVCGKCGEQINIGDYYYGEVMKDKFLHSLHRKKLCKRCYEEVGESSTPLRG